jgi:hypothetical protein
VIERVFGDVAAAVPRAQELVTATPLTDKAKETYRALLAGRAASLASP